MRIHSYRSREQGKDTRMAIAIIVGWIVALVVVYTIGMSATACKCTKTGKMKMWYFSGTKFAAGLAWEVQNPLP
jgi:hypothetical protein